MTRKDYEALAAALRTQYDCEDYMLRMRVNADGATSADIERARFIHSVACTTLDDAMVRIAKVLADDNPRFNEDQFWIAACGSKNGGNTWAGQHNRANDRDNRA